MKIAYEALVPKGRRRLIELSNFAIIVLISSLAALRFLILGAEYLPVTALSVLAIAIANAVYIRRNGSIDIAAYVLMLLLLLGLAWGGFKTHAFSGPVVQLAPLIPVFALLLINTRMAWISLGMVSVIFCGLLVFQVTGTIPENPNPPELVIFGRFMTLISLCIVITWIVWRFSRMSRLLVRRIEEQSNTDFLTGILNRRGLETALIHELKRASRSKGWISLILADVDHFKLYNDNNGHQAGDQCLIRVAQLIASCCQRPTDLHGRYGGEEFMIILPDTPISGAVKVAECIRSAVQNEQIAYSPDDNPQQSLSLTLGVVSARGEMIESMEQLIKLADNALYQGKAQSRNCVLSVVLGDQEEEA